MIQQIFHDEGVIYTYMSNVLIASLILVAAAYVRIRRRLPPEWHAATPLMYKQPIDSACTLGEKDGAIYRLTGQHSIAK